MSDEQRTHLSGPAIDEMPRDRRRRLVNSLSGWKSPHLLGSRSAEGINNLSLVNAVTHVAASPPHLGVMIRPPVVPRHSLENIRATGHFSLNSLHPSFLADAHQASAKYPAEADEFQAIGLTPWFQDGFQAPYVAESPICIGLALAEEHAIRASGGIFLVGAVQEVLLAPDLLHPDGKVDHLAAESLAVCGLEEYARPVFHRRLGYARPQEPAPELPVRRTSRPNEPSESNINASD